MFKLTVLLFILLSMTHAWATCFSDLVQVVHHSDEVRPEDITGLSDEINHYVQTMGMGLREGENFRVRYGGATSSPMYDPYLNEVTLIPSFLMGKNNERIEGLELLAINLHESTHYFFDDYLKNEYPMYRQFLELGTEYDRVSKQIKQLESSGNLEPGQAHHFSQIQERIKRSELFRNATFEGSFNIMNKYINYYHEFIADFMATLYLGDDTIIARASYALIGSSSASNGRSFRGNINPFMFNNFGESNYSFFAPLRSNISSIINLSEITPTHKQCIAQAVMELISINLMRLLVRNEFPANAALINHQLQEKIQEAHDGCL